MRDLPLDPSQYKTFLLHTGFAESGSASPVVISMSHDHEFPVAETWQEAWKVAFLSMREVFIAVVKKYHKFGEDDDQSNECCREVLAAKTKKKPKFCPDCGQNLSSLGEYTWPEGDSEDDRRNREELAYDVLRELQKATADSWGELWEISDNSGWQIPGYIGPGVITLISANADDFIMNFSSDEEFLKRFWENTNVFQIV